METQKINHPAFLLSTGSTNPIAIFCSRRKESSPQPLSEGEGLRYFFLRKSYLEDLPSPSERGDVRRTEGRGFGLTPSFFICICLTLFFANTCNAQYIWDERKGCIVAQGNLAPGYLIETKQVSAYVDGDMELFLSDRFAYEGAIWYSFATTHPGQPGVKANDALFAGGEYHFLKPSRWDPFASLTPGVGLVQVAYNNSEGGITTTPYCAVPLVSMSLGCNYYVGWIFHFFVKVQGVVGQTFSDMPTPQRIDEIKFTFGLGLNSRVWKPRRRDKWKEGMM